MDPIICKCLLYINKVGFIKSYIIYRSLATAMMAKKFPRV